MLRAFEQFHRLQNVELDAYYAVNRDHFARITNWAGFDYSLSYLERTAEALWPGEVDLRNPEFVKGKVWPVRYDSIVNEIARASGDIRDQHIYSELVHALELFDRAFVVYGGSHLLRQEPLLEAFFSGGESLR
jgi:hypothetical protein